MNKKIVVLFITICLLLIPVKTHAGKDYVADRFDVDIILNMDGSMQVTETITIRFMGGPFN
ncbi:MAG: hypothetical protein JW704_06960 [Anaerolineaceae bacterium]|nr:hypothetical protein [Anaerolineaceae bacterium]MBN2677309.1 hypothetical protein [Anaerolineaceae bacterium]